MTTYEEWRVTGTPSDGFGPLDHIRSAREGESDPEAAVRKIARAYVWTDGPHLHKRTVTDWTEVKA